MTSYPKEYTRDTLEPVALELHDGNPVEYADAIADTEPSGQPLKERVAEHG